MTHAVFDSIVMVDWSASSTPKAGPDSIWLAAVDVATGAVRRLDNPRTRQAAFEALVEICGRSAGRVLLGFDFPMGPPAGFTDRVVGALAPEHRGSAPWQAMWALLDRHIADDERNRNNRCVVADALNRAVGARLYWGAPARQATDWLTSTKTRPSPFAGAPIYPVVLADSASVPPISPVALADSASVPPINEFRLVESRLRSATYRPFSWWQMFGAGSVGSQAMLGIPVLQRLRCHPQIGRRITVWPFETGLKLDRAALGDDAVVIAEMWPSALPPADIAAIGHAVKDARQVAALALKLAGADRAGRLAEWFTVELDPTDTTIVCDEEGWVLGVDAGGRPIA